jgi:preprotein translocase subunit SecF
MSGDRRSKRAKNGTRATAAKDDAVVEDASDNVPPEDAVVDDAVTDDVIDDDVTDDVPTEDAPPTDADVGPKAPKRSIWFKLYHGETNVDFIGRRRLWFALSLVAVLIAAVALLTRGLNLGIDFEGGVVWQVPAGDASIGDARNAVDGFGLGDATIQELDGDSGREIRIEAEPVSASTSDEVTAALARLTGSDTDQVDLTEVGPSWGEQISEKAVRALVVFLILVTLYITLRFELKMAIPTLVALLHDIVITVGVYALFQFDVTPATVIAFLTILGYSIYDGIVVFDKVDENTRRVSSTGGLSYGGMVNVSLNQALMRSLNTTMTALLPVGSLLIVGSWIMGASTLSEFALALLIGLFSGAYSSIFIASPLLAVLKEREPRYRDIKRRIEARGGDADVVAATIAGTTVKAATATVTAPAAGGKTSGDDADRPRTVAPSGRAIPPRPRKKTRGRR